MSWVAQVRLPVLVGVDGSPASDASVDGGMAVKRSTAVLTALLWVAGTSVLGGCARPGNPAPPPSGGPSVSAPATSDATPTPAPPAASSPAPPAASSSGGTAAGWTTGPVAVTRSIPVPPVPRLLAIRPGTHPGYDRITFDFTGPLPGYRIGYVDKVVQDGSGAVVSMPGRRYLQIRFQPTQAHADGGGSTVTPTRRALSYPMLRGYVVNGDFEGVVNIALGLAGTAAFRVGEIPGTPGRLYVDVATSP